MFSSKTKVLFASCVPISVWYIFYSPIRAYKAFADDFEWMHDISCKEGNLYEDDHDGFEAYTKPKNVVIDSYFQGYGLVYANGKVSLKCGTIKFHKIYFYEKIKKEELQTLQCGFYNNYFRGNLQSFKAWARYLC